MIKRAPAFVIFALLSCAACFGQSSYKGITPGTSTKADVERVFGRPVAKVSETLVEYAPEQDFEAQTYVQYRDKSATAIVERIELSCTAGETKYKCMRLYRAIEGAYGAEPEMVDLKKRISQKRNSFYFGPPRLIVQTEAAGDDPNVSERWAFYSKELYESVAPKGGCTGTVFGEWETNRGRMTVTRAGHSANVKGTYSTNKGSFTGKLTYMFYAFQGEWSDSTGSGTMQVEHADDDPGTFAGTWKRTSGSGPAEGTWEGRCVQSAGGGKK